MSGNHSEEISMIQTKVHKLLYELHFFNLKIAVTRAWWVMQKNKIQTMSHNIKESRP